jgi:hypothetical protein
MNRWLYTTGHRELSTDELEEIVERVLELEEPTSGHGENAERQWWLSEGLSRLDAALREAAEYFAEIGGRQRN